MLNFSRFTLFVLVLIILPMIVNIVDNIVKILRGLGSKNYLYSKMVEFDDREFIDFILEFLVRAYKYQFRFVDQDIYIVIDNQEWLLYADNRDCELLSMYDIRNIIGICESKGSNNVFIFTTKIFDSRVVESINSGDIGCNIKYFQGGDFKLYYNEFVEKFY